MKSISLSMILITVCLNTLIGQSINIHTKTGVQSFPISQIDSITFSGSSWQIITGGFSENDNINGLAVDDNGYLWASVNSYDNTKGLYLSTNNGISFNRKLIINGCQNIITYGQNYVWAQADFQISVSTNGGQTWTTASINSWPDKNGIDNYGSDFLITVGWEGAIWKSTDRGFNWHYLLQPNMNQDFWGVGIATQNIIYVGGRLKSGSSIVYKSSNGGSAWNLVYQGQDFGILRILVIDSDTVYAVGNNGFIIRTTNGGNSWNRLNSNTSNNLHNIKRNSNGIIYIVGSSGTILSSSDGINFNNEYSGTTKDLEGLAISNQKVFVSGVGIILKKDIK